MDNILKLMDEYIKHEKILELEQLKTEISETGVDAIEIINNHIESLKEEA